MRYKGYVVTYVGETRLINNDNFFLNGFCKENIEVPFLFDRNKEFRSRNLYALASGVKSDAAGDELAYVAVDILKNFYVADFDNVNRELFHVANTAVTSQVLEKSNEHYEVDLSVLSIDRDVATVYNMGDIPVFYYENGKIENLAGKPPESVDLEKDYLDGRGEIQTKAFTKRNVPYIGTLDTDMEVVPYTSARKKLRKKAFFVLCSKEVLNAVDEATISEILGDKNIKNKHKALAILDKAIKAEPEGNYTIEVIVVNRGLAIAEDELRGMGKWLAVAGLCIALCLNGDFLFQQISYLTDGIKEFIQNVSSDEVERPADDLRWIPQEERENSSEAEEAQDAPAEETAEEASEPENSENTEESNEAEQPQQSQEQAAQPAAQPAPARTSTAQSSSGQTSQSQPANSAASAPQKSETRQPASAQTQTQTSAAAANAALITGSAQAAPSQPEPAQPDSGEQSAAPTFGGNETPLDAN